MTTQAEEHLDSYDLVGSLETSVDDGFTMVAVGDLIVTRPLTKGGHPGFDKVIEILRNADATLGNMETNIFDIRSFRGSPQAEFGGAYHASLPTLGPDLKEMGFNVVSYANNHTFDWGVEGMRETIETLEKNGIVHAGAGENLSQAAAARFLETPRGRVGLVSCAATFTPQSRAADPAAEAPGRPGINPLRLTRNVVVPQTMLEDLRRVRDALPGYKLSQQHLDKVILAETTYIAGSTPGFSYAPNPKDVETILRNVRRGKQYSDFCILANHGHEPGNWSQQPADYEQAFARSAIDAGADAYVAHGPHQLRGIEVYNGRPIFYSLANFMIDDLRTPIGIDMFETYGKDPRLHTDAEVTVAEMTSGYDTAPGFTDPVFYESIITVTRFERNQLKELRLYPVELGHSKRLAKRGIPSLASSQQSKSILERLQSLSKPFGTKITIVGDIGLIAV
ncbi:CapA family protein [Mesorhizobium sp. YC-39]|uniref:CapA family protein n=1 Tax=unclassified Mesorhizobium TaxID=325217 RepID=UPI0021E8518C|nr:MULTISPECIES: CapA family protein [unclassified Mesorhizobium]MCV3211594.1 CapA family protein [Mesorhizobium sp. YC-2]MCV3233356.1 CapA family protein [Mesorhizobium sp. YC-39]